MKVEKLAPEILQYSLRQERGDQNYGSCLWAIFNIDLKHYTLSIESDCGDYMYGWIPTPESESFLALLCRMDCDYLLNKIAEENVFDSQDSAKKTIGAVKEYYEGAEDLIDFDFDSLISDIGNLTFCGDATEFRIECENIFALYDRELGAYSDAIIISMDYAAGARRIVQNFRDYIQPVLRDELKHRNGATGQDNGGAAESALIPAT